MPTYEYECQKCGHHFDAFQRMSAEVYKTCPEELCQIKPWGKGKVKRLLGAGAGLIFKGSGFYITDYRSEGYKSSAKQETSSGATPSGTSEAKASSTTKSAPQKKSETPVTTTSKINSEKKKSS
ncbi:MAG: zinc ribbon domain-containing protein [Chthoniobacterales bacterium]|nr:zinc ribbon domain-containing protein [Chthoniobacterales bacterium]